MPRRNAITISLSDDLLAALDTMAPHHGGRSGAIQALIHDAGPNPQVSPVEAPPEDTPRGDGWYQVSDAGQAAIIRMAEDSGRTPAEVVRLALRHAFMYSGRWLTVA